MKLFWLIIGSIILLSGVVMLSKVLEDSYENPETKKFNRTILIGTKSEKDNQLKKTRGEKSDKINIETLTKQEAYDVYFNYCIGIGVLPDKQKRTCIKLKKHISKIRAEILKKYN